MVYDFYGNFPKIYPIDKGELKDPCREKWGYVWDMEDYMFTKEGNRGILLQGMMLNSSLEDFNFFAKSFEYCFRKTKINSLIKSVGSINLNVLEMDNIDDMREAYDKSLMEHFKTGLHELLEDKKSFLENFKRSLKRGRIWISLNNYWTELIQVETENFWGKDIRVYRFPNEYRSMFGIDLWSESASENIEEFNEDSVWEEFSYNHPNLVKYIQEEIRERINVTFLGDCNDLGIF